MEEYSGYSRVGVQDASPRMEFWGTPIPAPLATAVGNGWTQALSHIRRVSAGSRELDQLLQEQTPA